MARSKRKRRTKHRGTAAGTVEARGRTGRKPVDNKKSRGSRGNKKPSSRGGTSSARSPRPNRPPTWKGSFAKAGFMAAVLFIFVQLGLFGSELSFNQALVLFVVALGLYIPLSYLTDRAIYNWRLRRESGGGPPKKKR